MTHSLPSLPDPSPVHEHEGQLGLGVAEGLAEVVVVEVVDGTPHEQEESSWYQNAGMESHEGTFHEHAGTAESFERR